MKFMDDDDDDDDDDDEYQWTRHRKTFYLKTITDREAYKT